MNLAKQDRNGVRTPIDIERKYKLGKMNTTVVKTEMRVDRLEKTIKVDTELSDISTNAIQNKVVTEALNSKVDKIEGKQLSTNDFTDEDKTSIHIHGNKDILDGITSQDVLNWNGMSGFLGIVADLYDENSSYDVGDYVVYDNVLYKCKVAIEEAEFWNEDDWERTTIMKEVKGGGSVGKD